MKVKPWCWALNRVVLIKVHQSSQLILYDSFLQPEADLKSIANSSLTLFVTSSSLFWPEKFTESTCLGTLESVKDKSQYLS